MRGLPFRATDDEVIEFFAGYNIIPTSIKYKYDDQGRKSGQACILFQTKEDSLRAASERHKQNLGNRWIELNEIDMTEYERFDLTREGSSNVICGNRVTEENINRCVKLRGLPFSVTK